MRSWEKASQGHHKEGGCKWEKCDQTCHQRVSCWWEEQNSAPRRAQLYNSAWVASPEIHTRSCDWLVSSHLLLLLWSLQPEVFAGCRFVCSVQFLPVAIRGILESFPPWCVAADTSVTGVLPLLLLRSSLQDCSFPGLLSRRFLQVSCAKQWNEMLLLHSKTSMTRGFHRPYYVLEHKSSCHS